MKAIECISKLHPSLRSAALENAKGYITDGLEDRHYDSISGFLMAGLSWATPSGTPCIWQELYRHAERLVCGEITQEDFDREQELLAVSYGFMLSEPWTRKEIFPHNGREILVISNGSELVGLNYWMEGEQGTLLPNKELTEFVVGRNLYRADTPKCAPEMSLWIDAFLDQREGVLSQAEQFAKDFVVDNMTSLGLSEKLTANPTLARGATFREVKASLYTWQFNDGSILVEISTQNGVKFVGIKKRTI